MNRLALAALALFVLSGAALAQGQPASVVGPIIPGDCPKFQSVTVLVDSGGTCGGGSPGGSNGQVQYNNSGSFGGLTNTQVTALIGLATASTSGALPAWPNNTTTYFRGDGTYDTLNFAAIGGTITAAQCPVATGSAFGCVKPDNTSTAVSSGVISATPALLNALQGKAEFVNDGTAMDMAMIPYNGSSMVIWCPATSTWNILALTPAVSITGAANNGAGAVRVTHAATTRPFVTNQFVFISGVVGTTEINSTTRGAWQINVIDGTHFDLQGSTFTNAYVSGGTIAYGVYGRSDNITINGTAAQAFSNATTYEVGLQYLDAGCTVGTFVAQTTIDEPVPDPIMGFNLLSAYTSTPMVGLVYKDATLGIQGNGSSELVISWYSRNMVGLNQTYTGNTGGVLNSPVALTNAGGAGGVMRWLNFSDSNPQISCTFAISSTVAADIQIAVNITGANTFSYIQGIRHAGTGTEQVVINGPVEDQNAGELNLAVTLQTDSGTATSGVAYNSVCQVYTNF